MTAQLQQAITLIKAGKKQEGGRLLNQVLKADPANETAWLWAARIVGTDEKRIYCLNQALALNPQNQMARQALAKLEARTAATAPPPPTAPAAAAQQRSQPPTSRVAENVWLNLEGSLPDKLVILDDAGVVVANPDRAALQQIQDQLQQGQPLTKLPDGKATGIPLEAIFFVKTFQHTNNLSLFYKVKDDPKITTVTFNDAASRNEFFNCLRDKMGPGFQTLTHKYSAAHVMFLNGFAILVVGILTAVLYAFAADVQAGMTGLPRGGSGRTKLIALAAYILANLIGPTGIAIIGGIVILLFLVRMVKAIQNPPVRITLTRQSKETQ